MQLFLQTLDALVLDLALSDVVSHRVLELRQLVVARGQRGRVLANFTLQQLHLLLQTKDDLNIDK